MQMAVTVLTVVLLMASAAWLVKAAGSPSAGAEDDAARAERQHTAQWGRLNAEVVCVMCQHRQCVRTKPVTRKKGISGGKATAALLTGGVTMLATGLSRKEALTRAHCVNCGCEWDF